MTDGRLFQDASHMKMHVVCHACHRRSLDVRLLSRTIFQAVDPFCNNNDIALKLTEDEENELYILQCGVKFDDHTACDSVMGCVVSRLLIRCWTRS